MIRYTSIAAIAVAGLVHLIIAPGQLFHAPAHIRLISSTGTTGYQMVASSGRIMRQTVTPQRNFCPSQRRQGQIMKMRLSQAKMGMMVYSRSESMTSRSYVLGMKENA